MAIMTFRRERGGRVHLSEAAVATLIARRQLNDSTPEAGGIILGRLIVDSEDVVIDEVVGPLQGDRGSRFTFFRPKDRAQKIVEVAWESSRGTKVYLGEWHTHPENDPSPSSQDLRNWRGILRNARYEQDSLLFLIAGRANMRLWEVARGESVVECQRV
ncbi:MAG: Mov34/MPN/PAD-1 family protein [Bryobacteraceae bacterium]|nr:Mov34/MPN/PAD-1 family protein [Bryobacteraceae bacterium]